MNIVERSSERNIIINETMDDLRRRLFLTFDKILDGSVEDSDVTNAIGVTNSIISSIEAESDECMKRLQMEILAKERLDKAITILSNSISNLDELRNDDR